MLEGTFISEEVGECPRVFLVSSLLTDASHNGYNDTCTKDGSSNDSESDFIFFGWIKSGMVIIIIIIGWINWNNDGAVISAISWQNRFIICLVLSCPHHLIESFIPIVWSHVVNNIISSVKRHSQVPSKLELDSLLEESKEAIVISGANLGSLNH